jgi:murein DD-endopeptidase MepM/ murein hydrolase activator NlpD
MVGIRRRFPVAARAAAVALLLVAMGAPAAVASPQDEVDRAKREVQQLRDDLESMQRQLEAITADAARKAAQAEEAEIALERTTARLLAVQAELEETQARYEEISAQLEARAVQAYINGPGSSFEFLLGSTSLIDLSDRLAFVEVVAASDAELAAEVETTRRVLDANRAELERLQAQQRRQLGRAEALHAEVLDRLAAAEVVQRNIEQRLGEAQRDLKVAKQKLARWLATTGGGHIALPGNFRLERCPVDQPMAFWDGFGAPRYVGGYHLHRGVDMAAPEGTPVRAAIDGYARNATNTLGGNAVQVYGRYGHTYNAHLVRVASTVPGPVSAGDIIGWVGSTGTAGGSLPHNHFEFWPNVIPSGWPQSAYGYSVIDGAVNPYPLLVNAC